MPAGHQQQQIGEGDIVGEPHRQRMTGEMIDGDERQAAGERDRLRLRHPDDDAADEARPAGRRDRVEGLEADAGRIEAPFDQPVEMIQMRPRRNLRHDAAIGAMLGELREHEIGADALRCRRRVADHRRRRFVAARLDPQHQHGGKLSPLPFAAASA